MKKFTLLTTLALTVILSCLLTACSYKDLEDSIRNPQGDTDEYVNSVEKPQTASSSEDENNDPNSDLGVILNIGDTFITTAPGPDKTQEVSYTLNSVDIVTNINDVALVVDNFYQSDFWGEDGTLSSEGEQLYLVVADITITNINKSVEDFYIESFAGTEYGLFEDASGPYFDEIMYSDFVDKSLSAKAGYKLNFDIGESMTGKIAWIVTQTSIEDNIYYVMNANTGDERMSYFLLNP